MRSTRGPLTSPAPRRSAPACQSPRRAEQAARAAEQFRRAARLVPERPASDLPVAPGPACYRAERAAGVAGVITSWRTPFLAQARAVAPALAAGCTVVLSPDVWTPLPAALLAEITITAGLPDGVLNVVHGTGDWRGDGDGARTDVPDALAAHPHVARISPAAGTAGSPCLVFADADLDQATDSLLFGALALNGQRRGASSAVLAERPVYDAVVSRLAAPGPPDPRGCPVRPVDRAGAAGASRAAGAGQLLHAARRPGGRVAGRRRAAAARPGRGELPGGDRARRRDALDADLRGGGLRAGAAGHAVQHRRGGGVAGQRRAGRAPAAYLWTSDRQRAHRLATAIESAATWVNAHNAADLPESPGDIAFYTRSRTVHLGADGAPVPRLGILSGAISPDSGCQRSAVACVA